MPYKDPEKRRAYQRERVLTPEQKARKAARAKERWNDPAVRAAELENCRKRRARMTEAEKNRARYKAREAARKKTAAMTEAEREAVRERNREHDKQRARTPERREYHNQLKRRIRAAEKFDKDFKLPDAMICTCPDCERLAIHDSLGQTGLCPDHFRQSGHYLTRR